MQTHPARVRLWAFVRIVFGLSQTIGAVTTAILLLRLGLAPVTLSVFAITTGVSLSSVLIFRVLHLHEPPMPDLTPLKKYCAECFGTFTLVFAGTGAIVVNGEMGGGITHVGIALTFGLVVLAMIYAVGDISGAHLNPAVTLSFWAAGRFPRAQIAPYLGSQFAGALAASALLRGLFPANPLLGATLPAGGEWQSFVFEFVLTAILMFVILSVSTGAKERGITAGLVVGAVIALEAMFAGPVCGASMNPARSLAPAIVSGHLEHLWIYIVAPIAGAFFAVLGCRCMREEGCCSLAPASTLH